MTIVHRVEKNQRGRQMIRKILDVIANDDFTLICEMENGEIYKYDMSYVLHVREKNRMCFSMS